MRSWIILAMLVGAAGACPIDEHVDDGETRAWVELHPKHRWLEPHGNADAFRVQFADGSWELVRPGQRLFLYKPGAARVYAIWNRGDRQLVFADGWFVGTGRFDIWLFALFTVGFLVPARA
jgi:hypothetical protein